MGDVQGGGETQGQAPSEAQGEERGSRPLPRCLSVFFFCCSGGDCKQISNPTRPLQIAFANSRRESRGCARLFMRAIYRTALVLMRLFCFVCVTCPRIHFPYPTFSSCLFFQVALTNDRSICCLMPLSAKILVAGEPNVSYICSRYYRAPELIFGATNYTTNIGNCNGC